MKPHDRITIIRNRYRARDLRTFRVQVDAYFEQLADESEGLGVDWDGVRAARARINQMLPRVVQIVEAADLGTSAAAPEMLRHIFGARDAGGRHQEILDVLDMAIGVYDAGQVAAVARTLNPFYYLMTALGFLAGLPRRALIAIGLVHPRPGRNRLDQLTQLDAAVSRLTGVEQAIETRFAEMREWQSRASSEHTVQMTDMAERIDFLERVLAQQHQPGQLNPGQKKAVTPL